MRVFGFVVVVLSVIFGVLQNSLILAHPKMSEMFVFPNCVDALKQQVSAASVDKCVQKQQQKQHH